jgi:hypothetical protein
MKYTAISLQELLASNITGCIGYTTDGTYCGNPISRGNLHEANGIRDAIRSGADTAYIERKIPKLASLCLCKRRHQGQAVGLAQSWDLEDVARPSRPRDMPSRTQARGLVDVDQVFTEMNLMNTMLDRHDSEMRELAQRFKQTVSVYEEA